MNRLILLIITVILASNITILSRTETTITISNGSSDIRPRSLVELPFEYSYQNGYVYIKFTEDIGQAKVSVINFSTGETITKSGNTASRYWILPVSTSGSGYFIEVTTTSGDYYTAEL